MSKKKNKVAKDDKEERSVVFSTHPDTLEHLFSDIKLSDTSSHAKDDPVRIGIEKKGRGGKTVSIIYGLDLSESKAEDLCKALKKKCGVGGSVLDQNQILLQGDVRDNIIAHLNSLGYTNVKKTGG